MAPFTECGADHSTGQLPEKEEKEEKTEKADSSQEKEGEKGANHTKNASKENIRKDAISKKDQKVEPKEDAKFKEVEELIQKHFENYLKATCDGLDREALELIQTAFQKYFESTVPGDPYGTETPARRYAREAIGISANGMRAMDAFAKSIMEGRWSDSYSHGYWCGDVAGFQEFMLGRGDRGGIIMDNYGGYRGRYNAGGAGDNWLDPFIATGGYESVTANERGWMQHALNTGDYSKIPDTLIGSKWCNSGHAWGLWQMPSGQWVALSQWPGWENFFGNVPAGVKLKYVETPSVESPGRLNISTIPQWLVNWRWNTYPTHKN